MTVPAGSTTPTPAPRKPGFRLGYRPSLDGLRGLAVIGVMLHHIEIGGTRLLAGGGLGVDMFFVLSGFLITALLVQEWQDNGSVRLSHFYMRRVLRLLPALVLLLLALALVAVSASIVGDPRLAGRILGAIPPTFFYVSNWAAAYDYWLGPLYHTWTLSNEEQFYLLWPPFLLFLLRRELRARQILAVIAAGVLFSALMRSVLWHTTNHHDRVYTALDTRADSLLIGCALAILLTMGGVSATARTRPLLRMTSAVATLFMIALIAAEPFSMGYFYDGVYVLVAFAIAAIIAQLMLDPPRFAERLLTMRWLLWIGRISYGLYLWHWPIFFMMDYTRLADEGPIRYLPALALTFIAATVSYYGIERYFLRLKTRTGEDRGYDVWYPKTVALAAIRRPYRFLRQNG